MSKFEKVSFEEFKRAWNSIEDKSDYVIDEDLTDLQSIYDNIKLPKRATAKSAGYDFYAPLTFRIDSNLSAEKCVLIPTGIKVELNDDEFLMLLPRSGHGFKYGVELLNTAGIIDADYYENIDNEGHIMAKFQTKDAFDGVTIKDGTAYMQGIIIRYSTTDNDNADGERKGGFGSTGIG